MSDVIFAQQEKISASWADQIAALQRDQAAAKAAGKRGEAQSLGFKIRKMRAALAKLNAKGAAISP